jgi:hypothetical protein
MADAIDLTDSQDSPVREGAAFASVPASLVILDEDEAEVEKVPRKESLRVGKKGPGAGASDEVVELDDDDDEDEDVRAPVVTETVDLLDMSDSDEVRAIQGNLLPHLQNTLYLASYCLHPQMSNRSTNRPQTFIPVVQDDDDVESELRRLGAAVEAAAAAPAGGRGRGRAKGLKAPTAVESSAPGTMSKHYNSTAVGSLGGKGGNGTGYGGDASAASKKKMSESVKRAAVGLYSFNPVDP